MRLRTVWEGALIPFLDFLYPARCLGCDEPVCAQEVLCPACLSTLDPLPLSRAQSMATLASLTNPSDARMAWAVYNYEHDGPLARSIHAMKYQGMERIAVWLGRLAGERLSGTPVVEDDPMLVPVPLHSVKKRERGYNQAEAICRGISRETGLMTSSRMLSRIRSTASQSAAHLNRTDRGANVRGAFRVAADARPTLRDRPVLIVDDLLTTGATLGACAAAFLDAGVVNVRLLAVARPARA